MKVRHNGKIRRKSSLRSLWGGHQERISVHDRRETGGQPRLATDQRPLQWLRRLNVALRRLLSAVVARPPRSLYHPHHHPILSQPLSVSTGAAASLARRLRACCPPRWAAQWRLVGRPPRRPRSPPRRWLQWAVGVLTSPRPRPVLPCSRAWPWAARRLVGLWGGCGGGLARRRREWERRPRRRSLAGRTTVH